MHKYFYNSSRYLFSKTNSVEIIEAKNIYVSGIHFPTETKMKNSFVISKNKYFLF